ncbi:hypothetical protein SAMN04488082_105202 [Desulfomicrobium apsheronum]|uniref:Uncharacterized protein n=1 Tax=Desulfomicrobium apsheronum TaxID=52560 RepID=A0A1I3TI80_9BACT|nr:hypothetical protein [Desulfomicrobium apsheronum]SFJ69341.1 hypothetical protein SAMN04488082_105202 [Desulfomicrobium apsheronum]
MEIISINNQNSTLTIISRGQLRVTTEEWTSPTEHFERLQGNALELLLVPAMRSGKWEYKRSLLLFDYLLRVIDEPLISSASDLFSIRFRTLQSLFYGALGSERFINISKISRIKLAYNFYSLLKRVNTPVLLATHKPKAAVKIPEDLVQAFEKIELNEVQVDKLRPYFLTTKSGTEYNVLLKDMIPVMGKSFTNTFFDGLKTIARSKAKDTGLRDFGTTFAQFVSHISAKNQPITPKLLTDPSYVQTFLIDFMEYHFMKMVRRKAAVQEATIGSLQKLWSRYRIYWSSLASQKIVAYPMNAFPSGNPKLLSSDSIRHRKVNTDTTGNTTIITEKLITAVPLHITDEEATKLIFVQLKNDFIKVQTWLREHLNSFFDDYKAGQKLASEVLELPSDDQVERATRSSSKKPSLPLAIKYFNEVHGGYTDTSRFPTPVYPNLEARCRVSKERLSRYLGIPSRQEAMAFMALLASHDGRFSESAIATAKLLDSNGNRINAVETDAGIILTVLKERNAGDGWHDVVLKGEAKDLVKKWIHVTTPLRNHMMHNKVKGWQNIVIYTGNYLGSPAHFSRSSNINSTFRNFALNYKFRLGNLANQVTIPRIRSTRAVLVFLESMNLAKMAKELGNTNETSLRHYLPDSLWEYFTTRWIRIFQNLLIVEATRDTHYMQKALHFSSAAEMDEFLKNHAVIPLIPTNSELSDASTDADSERKADELMVAASPGIFTTLLSISEASRLVVGQGIQLSPQAVYWTEFTQRLRTHIESSDFCDHSIKQMMRAALVNANPANFIEVVRG